MAAILTARSSGSWCRPARPPPRGGCCVTLASPPERPDPAIYSQDEQLSLGQVPS